MGLPEQLLEQLNGALRALRSGADMDQLLQQLVDPEVARAIDSIPNRVNELGFDPWGLSPREAKLYYSLGRLVYRYFRPEIHGIENVPAGRVLIVPNHSGQLPFDGMVVAVACLLKATPPRLVRAMAERWVPTLPFVNEAFSRAGVVVGDPINCRNLLLEENAILVFPEGARGSGKVWKDRYKLRPFGRGFMRLALQSEAPIVPVAVVGAEESIISVYDWRWMARLLRMPYAPVSPLLPILGPLAYLPMPVKFHVYFGEPMQFSGPFDDEDAIIDEKVAKVQGRVQQLIDEGLRARKSIFF
ncbi:MAG TPA: lysophospholipid acyltransferase family protein [Polyangia bacterium]|nr:lysophospholipid acyltransferase family protein [Polyangia bacterium]